MDINNLTIGCTVQDKSGNRLEILELTKEMVNGKYLIRTDISGILVTPEELTENGGYELTTEFSVLPEYEKTEGNTVIALVPPREDDPEKYWTCLLRESGTTEYIAGSSVIKYVHQIQTFVKNNKK